MGIHFVHCLTAYSYLLYIPMNTCARMNWMSFSHPVIFTNYLRAYKLIVKIVVVGFLRVFRFQKIFDGPFALA